MVTAMLTIPSENIIWVRLLGDTNKGRVVALPFSLFYFYILILMLALWVHREPAFLHALTLLEYLKDTPKARTAYNSEYRTENLIVGEE